MTTNIYTRSNRLYLDARYEGKRYRISTLLKPSKKAVAFIKKNIALYLQGKRDELKKEFLAKEDKAFMRRLLKEENKEALKSDIDELISELLNDLKFAKQSSFRALEQNLRAFKNYYVSQNLSLNKFSSKHYLDYITVCKEELKNKQGTIRNKTQALKRLFNLAYEKELILKMPKFKTPKFSQSLDEIQERDVFTYEEAKELINKAKEPLKSYLALAFFTGARIGELLALQVKDINIEQGFIHIFKSLDERGNLTSVKTKSSVRKIDILNILEASLKKLCEGKNSDDFLFSCSRAKLQKDFKKLLQEIGFKGNVRLYDTRHSFASIMLSKGEEPMWVGVAMMGHKNLNITYQSYAKYLPKNASQRASFINKEDFSL